MISAPVVTESDKVTLRQEMRKRRGEISLTRRLEVASQLHSDLMERFSTSPRILSYASFDDELNTWILNQALARQGRLLLPRIDGNTLRVFSVHDIPAQLQRATHAFLEPIPKLCREVDAEEISVILVPGLAFDRLNHRLGYGKGYYDHFLPTLTNKPQSYGIGFKEQLLNTPLPISPHDISLSDVLLW